jgi:transposase-like protein
MDLNDEVFKQLKKDLSKAKSYKDLMGENGAIKKIIKASLEVMLETEMNEYLGYQKHDSSGNNSGNSRNGKTSKSILTDQGEILIDTPRDRKGDFEPVVVKKHERRLGELEDKIISMYAKGMTTRDIESHLEDIYGINTSASLISRITDQITIMAAEWQNRPLEPVYTVVYLDAIHFKVRDETTRRVTSKAAYTCLGIDLHGYKELLGLWIGEAEGASFWLNVLTELRNRGVKQILIACIDGLKGFPDAIQTVFPNTEIQLCIIHQLRNTFKYITWKDRKSVAIDLKNIYTAPTEQAALMALEQVEKTWSGKYNLGLKSWRENWPNLSPFFKYPEELRKIIYTTNAVESLNRQFRKVTKTKSIFPHNEALIKSLYLAYRDLERKWIYPINNWSLLLGHLSIIFEKQLVSYL